MKIQSKFVMLYGHVNNHTRDTGNEKSTVSKVDQDIILLICSYSISLCDDSMYADSVCSIM